MARANIHNSAHLSPLLRLGLAIQKPDTLVISSTANSKRCRLSLDKLCIVVITPYHRSKPSNQHCPGAATKLRFLPTHQPSPLITCKRPILSMHPGCPSILAGSFRHQSMFRRPHGS
jgi:hypothetical protein